MTSKSKSSEGGEGDAPLEIEVEGAEASGEGERGDGGVAIEVEEPGQDEAEAAPEEGAAAADELAAVRQALEEAEAKQKETYERLLRSVADLDNYRKRARRDVEDARVESQSRVLKEMLPVIDNLERALDHASASAGEGQEADVRGILEGVTLVLRQFSQAFERCGVKPIEAMHQPFDPNVHEAVGQEETAEHSPGTVVQVLQKGYLIGERLLRPALVIVSRAPAELPGPEETGNGRDRAPEEGNGEDRTGVEEEGGSLE